MAQISVPNVGARFERHGVDPLLQQQLEALNANVVDINARQVSVEGFVFFQLPSYPVASLPTAVDATGSMVFVSDAATGSITAFSDGTNWRRVDTRAIVS